MRKFVLVALIAVIGFIIYAAAVTPSDPNHPNSNPLRASESEVSTTQAAATEHAEEQVQSSLQNPNNQRRMECIGVNPWKTKPNGWTPPTVKECAALAPNVPVETFVGASDVPR
jgi:hypothetical protein